jgi:hypothetical protein
VSRTRLVGEYDGLDAVAHSELGEEPVDVGLVPLWVARILRLSDGEWRDPGSIPTTDPTGP